MSPHPSFFSQASLWVLVSVISKKKTIESTAVYIAVVLNLDILQHFRSRLMQKRLLNVNRKPRYTLYAFVLKSMLLVDFGAWHAIAATTVYFRPREGEKMT